MVVAEGYVPCHTWWWQKGTCRAIHGGGRRVRAVPYMVVAEGYVPCHTWWCVIILCSYAPLRVLSAVRCSWKARSSERLHQTSPKHSSTASPHRHTSTLRLHLLHTPPHCTHPTIRLLCSASPCLSSSLAPSRAHPRLLRTATALIRLTSTRRPSAWIERGRLCPHRCSGAASPLAPPSLSGVRCRCAMARSNSGRGAGAGASKDDDEDAGERSEEREALLAVVYANAPTLLDARRARQRKKRKTMLDEDMQQQQHSAHSTHTAAAAAAAAPHKQRKGVPAQPHPPSSSEQVLRALFVQELLMSALGSAPPP